MEKWLCWILVVFLFPGSVAFAQSSWELKKDKDGIRIYSRTANDSKFNELRAVFDLSGNFGQIRSILEDVSHYKDWVYSTSSSRLMERRSDSEMVYYSEISVPWPLSNRDFCSDTRIWMDVGAGQLRISSRNLCDFTPLKDHLVRIPFLRAEWFISMPSPASLHVEYTLAWNPGGGIPAWVANLFCTTGPLKSFTELKKKMDLLNPKKH